MARIGYNNGLLSLLSILLGGAEVLQTLLVLLLLGEDLPDFQVPCFVILVPDSVVLALEVFEGHISHVLVLLVDVDLQGALLERDMGDGCLLPT